MSTGRKILIAVGILILVIIAAIFYIGSNLDRIVKDAIERYGSQALGTSVRVSSVSLKPTEGSGSISGLTVANPSGFGSKYILDLGGISVRINPKSIASNPIVIEEVRIASPQVFYEMDKSGKSNVDELKKNIGAAPASGDKAGKKSNKRIRIDRFVMERAKVEARITALGDKPQALELHKIEMTDVGGKSGASPEQIAKQLASAIATEVARETAQAAGKKLESEFGKALKKLKW